jgi:hypothetical protein
MTGHDQPGTGKQGGRGPEPAHSPGVGRRGFLKGISALGAAGMAGVAAPSLAGARTVASRTSTARSAPAWVISPYAKKSHLETTVYEHTSTLKFIEAVFGLPTLASINHRFDVSTPGGPNNEASGGQPTGPPAPPRDGRSEVGNLMECFTF